MSVDMHSKAVDITERMMVYCSDLLESDQKRILLLLMSVKSLHASRQYIRCFELL